MLIDVARGLAEPAEKLLTQSFRFVGWVIGRAAAPVFSTISTAGRPAARTLSTLSPAAAEALWAFLPGTGPARPTMSAASPGQHDDLPVANWDGLAIAAIRQRTAALGEDDILTLLAYERAHASRPAVLLTLQNRLAKRQRQDGTQPA